MDRAAVTAGGAVRGTNRRAAVLLRSAASAAGGVVLYASFPPRTVWWLAPVAFALLGGTLYGRRARAGFGYGYLFGVGFLLPLLVWTGSFVGSVPWLLLAGFEALFCGAAGAGMAVVSRTTAAPVFAAALWVAGEAARARVPFGGFPWGKIAFGQPDGAFLPLAALGGAPMLSFAVAVSGLGLAELVRRGLAARRHRGDPADRVGVADRADPADLATRATRANLADLADPADRASADRADRIGLVIAVLAVVLPVLAGLAAAPLLDDAPQGTLTVALVQGNVPQAGLDFNAQRRAVLDNHRARTEQLAADVRAGRAPQPDLVLWPENAADIDPIRNADAAVAVEAAAEAIRAPILVGAILDPPDSGPFNAVVLWQPGVGPTAQYVKRHV
jgi:apolipoprotein N-acyltransferase